MDAWYFIFRCFFQFLSSVLSLWLFLLLDLWVTCQFSHTYFDLKIHIISSWWSVKFKLYMQTDLDYVSCVYCWIQSLNVIPIMWKIILRWSRQIFLQVSLIKLLTVKFSKSDHNCLSHSPFRFALKSRRSQFFKDWRKMIDFNENSMSTDAKTKYQYNIIIWVLWNWYFYIFQQSNNSDKIFKMSS